jgi:hypothetical protein
MRGGAQPSVPGKAVQVDRIKPKLKLPGTVLSKPKYDEALSNSAFKFNLRRYNQVKTVAQEIGVAFMGAGFQPKWSVEVWPSAWQTLFATSLNSSNDGS